MTKKNKKKTVDDIVSDYQKYHYRAGKSFKERIKKFEEFHDPDNIHSLQFAHHAHYIVFGKPTDKKEFPGAYNEAYKVLDKHVSEDMDKLKDEGKLTEILETYVDSFLHKAMGDKFKGAMEHAKEENLSEKEIRDLKGILMGEYCRDEEGRPLNVLDEKFIKGLKGKKKIEIAETLKNVSENIKNRYTSYLQQKALDGLISEEDRLDMAKYITPIFKQKGLKHETSHILRSAEEQAMHYGLLMQGLSETLIKKIGYKPYKEKPKKK